MVQRAFFAGVFSFTCILSAPAAAAELPGPKPDEQRAARGKDMTQRAIAFLRTQQDSATGGWSVRAPGEGPQLPAITALVLTGMVMDPAIDATDPAVARGAQWMLSFRKPSGGIYDRILPSYNTSICLSALARLNTDAARAAITPAQSFLRTLQWSESSVTDLTTDEASQPVDRSHPFYGGVGYGRNGRPDNSNLIMMLQGLHDSGIKGDDPAFQRALVFLQRTQMLESVNDMPYAKGSRQGGFIYATSENKDRVGIGQSFAGVMDETLSDGTVASRFRSYGSMTYGGFKSMIYADLKRDDERVTAAYEWIRQHYTLAENPGMGTDGLYYYYLTFTRALDAWGEPTIEITPTPPPGEMGTQVLVPQNWANDLIDRLAALQEADGSFKVMDDRWMESNKTLITAYSLIALQHALGND